MVMSVRTLAERVEWVQVNRELTLAEWGQKAGLSRGVVPAALKREKEGKEASFGATNNNRLAQAANVDPHWLSTGEGSPEPMSPVVPATEDTQGLVNQVARMLVDLDGHSLADALVALHDVRLPAPNVDGYYRAARAKLAGRRSILTRKETDEIVGKIRSASPRDVVRARKKRD